MASDSGQFVPPASPLERGLSGAASEEEVGRLFGVLGLSLVLALMLVASTKAQIYNTGSGATPTFAHSILEGGLEGISENNGSATVDGGTVLDLSPRFVDVNNPSGRDNTFAPPDDGLNVAPGSSAIDAGANDSTNVSIDMTGAARIGDGDGTATINMGPYEAEPPPDVIVPSAPDQLIAEETGSGLQLRWTPVDANNLSKYRIYRDTDPIEPPPSESVPVDSVPAADTSYTDTTVVQGQTYYYRVTAVDSSENESDFSPEARVFLYPQAVTAEVRRPFGTEGTPREYRLVALPGQVNRPLADAISGAAGIDWLAYLDDGSETNFFLPFDGSSAFTFRPGNGFWLTATRNWIFNDTFPTVDLQGDSVATIPLREGWNVISNPIGKDVAWGRVEEENPGSLQALFGFEGTFSTTNTFRSAKTGVAYYFFNDDTTRTSLEIPYPGAPDDEKTGPAAATARPSKVSPLLALTASPTTSKDTNGSTVRIGIEEGATRGLRTEDLVAPPSRFEAVSLRIKAANLPASTWPRSKRARFLMTERRPPAKEGQTFPLRLTSQIKEPIELVVENFSAVGGREVALLHPSAGTSYDLRVEAPVTIEPHDKTTRLTLAIGTGQFVEDKRREVTPDAVQLTAHPNPVRRQGTIEYALPEAQDVRLVLYDVLGRRIAVLIDGTTEAGRHEVHLDADQLSSGVYFARLKTTDQTLTRKITVMR